MIVLAQQAAVQEASLDFFVPLAAAYGVAMGLWWLITAIWPNTWPAPERDPASTRPWLDLLVCVGVVVGVLGIGQLYNHDLLLPKNGNLWFLANQLLIFSPLFLALIARRQGGNSIWVTTNGLPAKLAFGSGLGVLAMVVFLAMRGELRDLPNHLLRAVEPRSLSHFFPVFMEGVGLAFLFVRLQWVLGRKVALLLPALLFAAAHIPRALADGADAPRIVAFFVFNTAIVIAVLAVLRRSRDVTWLGLVHYLMDIPSGAF